MGLIAAGISGKTGMIWRVAREMMAELCSISGFRDQKASVGIHSRI